MARPRIDDFWIDQIRVLVANDAGLSGAKIRRELQKSKGPGQVPSARAIRRVKEEFLAGQTKQQVRYQRLTWPEAMESEALPWEASHAALELLHYYRDAGLPNPLVRECLWFWRVTLAAPALSIADRQRFALYLVADEMSGGINRRKIETALIYNERPDITLQPGAGAYVLQTMFGLAKGAKHGRQRSTKRR